MVEETQPSLAQGGKNRMGSARDMAMPTARATGLRPQPPTASSQSSVPIAGEPFLFDEFEIVPVETVVQHQSQLPPAANKFHVGNGDDGKHYWLTPPALYAELNAEFGFDFDPCPFPLPDGFDGLTCDWGQSNYVNPPFGSIIHEGRKKGPTAWVRKAISEWQKGKRVVLVYPVDKWLLMLLTAILGEHAKVRNLGDVKWLATEDKSAGKGTGRHIACFILEPANGTSGSARDPQGLEPKGAGPVPQGCAQSPSELSQDKSQ